MKALFADCAERWIGSEVGVAFWACLVGRAIDVLSGRCLRFDRSLAGTVFFAEPFSRLERVPLDATADGLLVTDFIAIWRTYKMSCLGSECSAFLAWKLIFWWGDLVFLA